MQKEAVPVIKQTRGPRRAGTAARTITVIRLKSFPISGQRPQAPADQSGHPGALLAETAAAAFDTGVPTPPRPANRPAKRPANRPANRRVPPLAVVVLFTALASIPMALLAGATAAAWLLSLELAALAIGRTTQPDAALAPFSTRAKWLDVTMMAAGSIALAFLAVNVPTGP